MWKWTLMSLQWQWRIKKFVLEGMRCHSCIMIVSKLSEGYRFGAPSIVHSICEVRYNLFAGLCVDIFRMLSWVEWQDIWHEGNWTPPGYFDSGNAWSNNWANRMIVFDFDDDVQQKPNIWTWVNCKNLEIMRPCSVV